MACGAAPAARTVPRPPDLAEILRRHADVSALTCDQRRVVSALTACRTAALGGHVRQCDRCGHRQISYNSCRDRHCPKCAALPEARWVQARRADLLPVEYFHVVFTIPDSLGPLFLANRRVAYDMLFAAASETLLDVARNPAHLGARIGLTAVLHTWTQQLLFHPHIHCIVPGGGLSEDGSSWISSRPGFLLPVRVLSKVFRGKLLSRLRAAAERLRSPVGRDILSDLRAAASTDWVVYSKPPFAGPESVLRYLGRYTHRIAISNERIVALRDGQVAFRWRDRRDDNRNRLLTLDAAVFVRRFLLHVLPRGFVRIRHYGFLANPARARALPQCRRLLRAAPPNPVPVESALQILLRLSGRDASACPSCSVGVLVLVDHLLPSPLRWSLPSRATSP